MSLNEDWGDLDNENRPTSSASSTRPNQHLIISAADREPFHSTENLSDSDEVVSESDYQNSPEAKRYRKITPKIDVNDEKFTRRPLRNRSTYATFFVELFEGSESTALYACTKCKYYTNKRNYRSMRKHIQHHIDETEPLLAAYRKALIAPLLKTHSFNFYDTNEFHQILTAFANLSIEYNRRGVKLDSKNVTPSSFTLARRVRELTTDVATKEEFRRVVTRLGSSGAICYDWTLVECQEAIRELDVQLQIWDQQHAPPPATRGRVRRPSTPRSNAFAPAERPMPDLESEMANYEQVEKDGNIEDFDLLGFWRDENSFPSLKRLATKILCIPASSASAERAFSHLRRIRSDFTRYQLGEKTISAIICCGSLRHFDFLTDD